MPANLTLKYLKAERDFRRASTPAEELDCLQTMLSELPKHKGTDKMHADIKQRISRLKKQIAEQHKKSSTKGPVYRLPRQGAGRAIIVGPPNSGKSQLLAALTKAKPAIAEFPYTTTQPMPGMMPWEDVAVQLIDTPPVSENEFDQSTCELVRGADLVLLMMDLGHDDGGEQLQRLVEHVNSGKTRFGRKTEIDHQNIGVTNTETILLANKSDLSEAADRLQFFDEFLKLDFERHVISALAGNGLPKLSERIFNALEMIRVYTKHPTKKEPDMDSPFTIKNGSTISDLAELVHKDIARNLKGARVWGSEVHDGTMVKPDYVVNDKDVVELHA